MIAFVRDCITSFASATEKVHDLTDISMFTMYRVRSFRHLTYIMSGVCNRGPEGLFTLFLNHNFKILMEKELAVHILNK